MNDGGGLFPPFPRCRGQEYGNKKGKYEQLYLGRINGCFAQRAHNMVPVQRHIQQRKNKQDQTNGFGGKEHGDQGKEHG